MMKNYFLIFLFAFTHFVSLNSQNWSLDSVLFTNQLNINIEAELEDKIKLTLINTKGEVLLELLDDFEVLDGIQLNYEFDHAPTLLYLALEINEKHAVEKIFKLNNQKSIIIVKIELDKTNLDLNNLLIYPNPSVNGKFFLRYMDESNNYDLKIFNNSGQVLFKEKGSKSFLLNRELDLSNFANGTYVLKLHVGGKEMTERIVKTVN
ncbi:MAG: T9SS type A sorting domain-containing protein [Bacteroidetes bacterium]|nr:T9SS type A sorting domain-containing protein [Bacteroidota bacterium]